MMKKKIKLNLRMEVSFDPKSYKKLSNGTRVISGTANLILQDENWPVELLCKVFKDNIVSWCFSWRFPGQLPKTIQQKIRKVYTDEKILEMLEELKEVI